MAVTPPQAEPRPRVLDPVERREFFDTQARALLGMSGEEFLRRWDRGDFTAQLEAAEDSALLELAMLIPFGR